MKNIILKLLKIILALVVGGIVTLTAWEYWESTHRMSFNIEDKYKINLFADECGLCFLDWQVDFVIRITDLTSNTKYKYEFWMGEGPYFEFGIPKDGRKEMLIRGSEYNEMHNWLIDFEKNEIEELSLPGTIEELKEKYVFQYKLDGRFQVEKE